MATKATTKKAKPTKRKRAAKAAPAPTAPVSAVNFSDLFALTASVARAMVSAGYGSDGHTHEGFVHAVRALATSRLPEGDDRTRLDRAKLCYGLGAPGLRGVTVFGTWANGATDDFIEVCAAGEESPTQLAGTTIHELAHCLAGHKAGHGKEWKEACERLGLRRAKAAGHRYLMAGFDPKVREGIAALAVADGMPSFYRSLAGGLTALIPPRPCSLGIGTRGGKSRGAGSGSRLRKYVCGGPCKQIIRAATDDLQATHETCGTAFTRADAIERRAA
jgi:hypothetical protein